MTDMNLSIKLTTSGGNVVVKEINGVKQAATGAADGLTNAGKAGDAAEKGFNQAGRSAQSLDSHMAMLRRSVGLLIPVLTAAGATAFFKSAIDEQEQMQRNMLRTEAVIRATGGAAGFTAQELKKYARELALDTLQSTEGIMRAQQVLLSYSNITGDVFTRAIESATDLSTLIDGGLNGSLEMLAKVLDDPIQGINAMRRQGIYFSEAQKQVIKSLVDTNQLAKAQTIILDELAGQFGGIARTEASMLAGAEDTLAQAIQEAKIAMADQAGAGDALAGFYNNIASEIFEFNEALVAGDLDGHIKLLKLAATGLVALAGASVASSAANGIWTLSVMAATRASALFSAQNALTAKSLFSIRTAGFLAAAAFVGWEIGTYLREEFAEVERAGIALTAGIHKGVVFLNGQFNLLAEGVKYALTNPLDFAREKIIDYIQWVMGLGGAALKALGLDNVFAEMEGKLDGYRSKTGVEHKATLDQIKQDTKTSLAAIDDEYFALFENVGAGAERAARKIADMPKTVGGGAPDDTADVAEFNQAMLALYNTQKLYAEAVDQSGRALSGIDLELYKANFKEATELPAAAAEAIREFYAAAEAANNAASASAYLESLQQETQLLNIRLQQGQAEYEIQKALYQLKGGDPAVLAAIEAELRAHQALNEQIAMSEEIASGTFNKMLDDMSALTSAGGDVGDVLTQAFGRVAQQINGMSKSQRDYNKMLDELQKKREKVIRDEKDAPTRAKALLDIKKTEARLQSENYQAQIGQFAALTGAAAQMFGEQSKEREALHKMEMAFSAIEMAMAIQRAAANALTAITNQGSGDPYTAFARIAAMAALMAGLGVFSGSASSSGPSAQDRQASQGTGTVLGDPTAKSNSIANALERIESLELDQYSELRAINASIKAMNAGIAQLAVSLVQNFGRFDGANYEGSLGKTTKDGSQLWGSTVSGWLESGDILGINSKVLGDLFGSVKKELTDSGLTFNAQELGNILATGLVDASYYNVIETTKKKLFGLSKKKSESTEYEEIDAALAAELGRIYSHIGTSISGAVSVLGIDAERALEDFVINIPKISFKDLSGDEIEKQLQAMFSAQADAMAQFVVPGIAQYQQMGEGLYDTLLRVAQEQAVFNAQMDSMGLSLSRFGAITAETQVEVTQAIITLMGGIEQFRDMTGAYFDAFYSDSEKFAFLSKSINSAFADLGQSLPGARDGFKELVGSIDITTEAGANLFTSLMNLVPGMDQYYAALERRAEFEKEFQTDLAMLDMTPLQRSLAELETWYQEQITTANELGAETVFIEKLYARKRADIIREEFNGLTEQHERAVVALTKEHEQSVAALTKEYEQLFKSIDTASNGIGDAILAIRRQMGGWSEADYQGGVITDLQGKLGTGSATDQIANIQSLQKAISARYNAELADSKKLADAAQQRYQTELAAVNAMRQAAQQLRQAADAMLLSEASPALLGSQLAEAQKQFDTLFKSARGGDATAAQQLSGVGSSYLSIAKDFYAQGSNEYAAIFEQIEQSYRKIGMSSTAEPPVPAAIRQYQERDALLQSNAIEQLEQLQTLLAALREEEQEALDARNLELVDSYVAATDELLAAQQDQITATLDAAGLIVDAINTNTANAALIAELQQQRADAVEQNKVLVAEIGRMRGELTRVTANAYASGRVG